MTEAYVSPRASVSFGDIFDLEFLHDVHVRSDAVTLGARTLPLKAGGGESYAPTYPNPKWVLAHGQSSWAVLITDNCLVDTALGQDRVGEAKPKGRLLFAPVGSIDSSELPLRSFGRFALPAWQGVWACGAADLRRCFMVDARDVAPHREQRKASLDAQTAEQLEIRWSAFAARRGPLVSTRNSEKLGEVLMRQHGEGELGPEDEEIARAVATTLAVAWRLEGSDLEAVADAHFTKGAGDSETADLAESLRVLASEASHAADLLEARLRPVDPA